MKRLILFFVGVVICVGFQRWANCSRPLDSINETEQAPPETVTIVDTIIIADTMFCARLNSHRQEIVWMFHNQGGQFRLEFIAITERSNPSQTLVIDIDNQQFLWRPADRSEFIVEQNLEHNANIRITSVPPHAYGQAIDLCLRIEVI